MKTLFGIYKTLLLESETSEKAKKLGLHHVGFGNYQTKSGKVTYRYDDQQKKFIKAGQSDSIENTEDNIQNKDVDKIQSYRRSIVAKTDPRKEFARMDKSLYENKNYSFYIDKNKLQADQFKLQKDVPFKSEKHKNILQHNARKIISMVSKNLDSGETNQLYELSSTLADNMVGSGISVNEATNMLNDSIGKLLYQEEESRGRQLGDHGVRHVVGDVIYADKFANELNKLLPPEKKMNNRRKLLMNLILLNHDMGYTTELVRGTDFKPSDSHPAIGMKMFVHELSEGKYKGLKLKPEEITFIKMGIATHDNKSINWDKQPEISSIRLADNMALFQKDKLPFLFKEVDNSRDILEKLHKDCKENGGKGRNALIKELMMGVKATNLPVQTKHNLYRASRETSCRTASVTLGMWAGELDDIKFEKSPETGKIFADVKIKHNEYNKKLAEAGFNLGQDKFNKFAKSFGVKNLSASNTMELKDDSGSVVLKSEIVE